MDITAALAPTSDQLDAVELVTPRKFTIAEGGKLGTREGKTVAEIRLVGFPRVWRPSKGMLDVLAKVWGANGSEWVGRSVTLYCDPEVTFGKEKPGGVRISHMSGIDKPTTVTIRARGAGKVQLWTVKPIAAPAQVQQPALTEADVNAATDVDTLRAWWAGNPHLHAAITARVDALREDATEGGERG